METNDQRIQVFCEIVENQRNKIKKMECLIEGYKELTDYLNDSADCLKNSADFWYNQYKKEQEENRILNGLPPTTPKTTHLKVIR